MIKTNEKIYVVVLSNHKWQQQEVHAFETEQEADAFIDGICDMNTYCFLYEAKRIEKFNED